MSACGEEGTSTAEAGTLFITGFENSYNDKFIEAEAVTDKGLLFAVKSYDAETDEQEKGQIKNRRVMLSVYEITTGGLAGYAGSTGNDEEIIFNVFIYDAENDPEPSETLETKAVIFKKGIGIAEIVLPDPIP